MKTFKWLDRIEGAFAYLMIFALCAAFYTYVLASDGNTWALALWGVK